MANIDIVMSVHNEEMYISEMLDSLKNQTYSDWSLIVRDNNSDDRTSEIIKKYAQNDKRIFLLEDTSSILPVYMSFGEALKHSNSKYIMFADGDDVWLPNKIEVSINQIKDMEKNAKNFTPFLCFTDLKVVNEKLHLIHESMNEFQRKTKKKINFGLNNTLLTSFACGNTFIFNKYLLDISLPIPKGAIMHDVWFFNIALMFGKINQISESTILYRQHSGNFSGSSSYIANIMNNIKNPIQIKQKINNRINLAALLLQKYKNLLPKEHYDILDSLASINSKSFFRRRKVLYKNKFSYKNFFKNLALYIWI